MFFTSSLYIPILTVYMDMITCCVCVCVCLGLCACCAAAMFYNKVNDISEFVRYDF